MFDTIRHLRPQTVFEVGTWRGGGSTLFIAQALYELGGGVLHTVELDPNLSTAATQAFRDYVPHLTPHVQFHTGSSTLVFPAILKQSERVDAVFLDGIGAEQTLAEFQLFEPYLGPGSILMCHDWLEEKTALLRPFLAKQNHWRIRDVLGPPNSIGFAVLNWASSDPVVTGTAVK